MNSCPAPDPTSIGYLTGSYRTSNELGLQGICPMVVVSHSAPQTPLDVLRHPRMDLELSDIARFIGAVLRLIATMLVFISTPVFWFFGALFSLVASILGLLITPLFIPWRITVWFWDLVGELYEDNKVSTPRPTMYMYGILLTHPSSP
jgi:hypothetical protein